MSFLILTLCLVLCMAVGTMAFSASLAESSAEKTLLSGKHAPPSLPPAAAISALAAIGAFFAVRHLRKELRRSREIDASLQEQKELLEVFTEGIENSAVFVVNPDGTIRTWNSGAERLFGYHASEIVGSPYAVLHLKDDVRSGKHERGLTMARSEGRHESAGLLLRKTGAAFHARSVVKALKDRLGSLRGFSVFTRDMTEMKQAEDLLKMLSLSVEQSADLVLITDRNGKVVYANKAIENVTGCTRQDFMTQGLELLRSGYADVAVYGDMWNTVLSGCSFQAEVILRKKNGEQVVLDKVVTPITDPRGSVTHALFTGSDITPLKVMHEKLSYLTSYDDLTGLPKRDLFAERLNRDLERSGPGDGTMAVLALNIDRFKHINEIYGLEAGNKVLQQVAESLSVSVSRDDTVARLGSDEFGIVLHNITSPTDVILFVKMIMKNVPQIIMSGGEEVSVTLSAGIALHPGDGRDAPALMKHADIALSKSKAQGRNSYQFYTPDMNADVTELVLMERRLMDALKNQEYTLNYQPYCHLSSGRVAGTEALLKWKNREFGLVSPVKFIPMLEETGMIIDVGKWVLRTACEQLRAWDNGRSAFPVAVNLSASQFRHEHLAEMVESTIREFGVDPRRLTLELTESIFMKDQDFTIPVLKRLKDIGVAIAIDDFGTGYSSLSYLKRFPVDYVKIDRSFVQEVATDPDATSLVTAIINMAHSLGLKTIAEGVETEDQWKILRLLKCDMAQGYYFSAAIPAAEVEQYLA